MAPAGSHADSRICRCGAEETHTPTVNCSMEEFSLAIGETVGYESVKSASRMNNGVDIFLGSVDKVSVVVK